MKRGYPVEFSSGNNDMKRGYSVAFYSGKNKKVEAGKDQIVVSGNWGLNKPKILAYIEMKKDSNQELSVNDRDVEKMMKENTNEFICWSPKDDFYDYIEEHGFVLQGVTSFYIKRFEGWHEYSDSLYCIINVGSEAYKIWQRETTNEKVEFTNKLIQMNKQEILSQLDEIPIGMIEGIDHLKQKLEELKELKLL